MRAIQSLQHPLVKHLTKLRSSRQYRHETGHLMVVGKALTLELTALGSVVCIVTLEGEPIPEQLKSHELVSVTAPLFKKIAGMPTDETLIAELRMPAPRDLREAKFLLALDRIQDPGNLGSLMRTSAALGWEGVIFLEGCVDPFNEKVIRASRGALFSLPYSFSSAEDFAVLLKTRQYRAVVGHLGGIPLDELSTSPPILLVLGNEAQGPSQAVRDLCIAVEIPMSPPIESLNVAAAGAILMHALKPKSAPTPPGSDR